MEWKYFKYLLLFTEIPYELVSVVLVQAMDQWCVIEMIKC